MNRCKNCKKETKNKTYCSIDCRNKGYTGEKRAKYVKIKCRSCGGEFESTKRLINKGKKYCSTECQYEGYRKRKVEYIKSNCLFCDNEFEDTEYRINTIGKKYCSRKCKDTHQKELYKGEENPVYGTEHSEEWKMWQSDRVTEMWKCDEHRKKVKEGIEKFIEENGYYPGTDEDSKNKRKETYLKKHGVDHNWKVKEIREKCEETNIKRYGKTSVEIANEALKRTPVTKIESKIYNILTENNIEFESEFKIYYDKYKYKKYDLFLPKHNLLIEADGVYWHGHPDLYETFDKIQLACIKNDKFKNELAKTSNHNLIRFWGNEIKKEGFKIKLLEEIKRWEKKLE